MEATARVLSVSGGRARIACEERASCGACGAGGRCALKWFAGPAAESIEVPDRTDDRLPLQVGEAVTISVADGEVLRAAATVYLPPLAGLLGGALLGRWVTGPAEAGALMLALLGAAIGWYAARSWSRRHPPRLGVRHARERAL
jgi:sigma-E factor negative regulatory protein RseC